MRATKPHSAALRVRCARRRGFGHLDGTSLCRRSGSASLVHSPHPLVHPAGSLRLCKLAILPICRPAPMERACSNPRRRARRLQGGMCQPAVTCVSPCQYANQNPFLVPRLLPENPYPATQTHPMQAFPRGAWQRDSTRRCLVLAGATDINPTPNPLGADEHRDHLAH